MFTHDFASVKHYTSKIDGQTSYENFCAMAGINAEDFLFMVKTGRFFKGKPINFTITSWGSYVNASGDFVIFVAYYSAPVKHTIQYSWGVGEDGRVNGVPRKYEFIGV